MIEPTLPINDQERVQALESYQILDTLSEKEYDDITLLASEICQVPITLISLVDSDRQWFKSKVGLDALETSRQISFCGHAINTPDEIFIVPDAREDIRFMDNPLVKGSPDIVFYAGVPLVDDAGYALGTLCAIDTSPRKLTEKQQAGLKVLAGQIVSLLSLRRKSRELNASIEMLKDSFNFSSPYYIWLNKDNRILECGDNFKKSIPGFCVGKSFDDFFVWDRAFDFNDFFSKPNNYNKLLFFQTKDNLQRYKCSLKKHDNNSLIIFSTAVINTKYPILNYKLSLLDFPQHDYIAEYLFLQQASTRGLEDAKKLNSIVTQKNKELEISKKLLINSNNILEQRVQERTSKIKNLALFPEHNPNPILELDLENKTILYANTAAKLLFEQLINLPFDEIIGSLGIERELSKDKVNIFFEFNFLDSFYSAKTYHLDDSKILRIYFNNITQIKITQQKEKEKNDEFIEQQKILLEVRGLSNKLSFDEKLKSVLKQAMQVLKSDRSSFWFFDDKAYTSITSKFILDSSKFIEGGTLFAKDFPKYFKSIINETKISATDACNHNDTAEFKDVYLNKLGIVSMLDIPVIQSEGRLGVICFEYFKTKEFSERDIAFARSISDAIMLAYEAEQLKLSKAVLEEKSISLEETLSKLINAQNDLIKQEKLATLGLLIAGIAHEINTPLGAIKASNDNIIDTINSDILNSIRTYEADIIKFGFELFSFYKKPSKVLSTREERVITQLIEKQLLINNETQKNANFYARKIFELGYRELDFNLNFYLEHGKSYEIFTLAIYFIKIISSSNTINVAVDKATKVLRSLSTFSHGNPNDEIINFNLRENIESVITILWNKIKYGAKVINEIKDDFVLNGNPEELAQVWTNIINNALQASDNKCTLKISCQCNSEFNVIAISNNGPMIPADILPNIFEAFYTTKKRGEGTGLGLNIIKNIIEKHNGNIRCTSSEQETVFYISIPVNNNL